MNNQEILYEFNAERRTAEGWCCKKCNRWWGNDEHMARYCCSTTFPCECGGRHDKYRTKCQKCIDRDRFEKWYAKPEVEWDGEFPIALWDNDEYFFDKDSLRDYLTEGPGSREGEEPESLIEGLRLTTCRPNNGRDFSMSEFLCDDLTEEQELDCDDVDRVVNDWINAHAPFSWSAAGERLSIESVKRVLFPENEVPVQ